MKRRAFKKAILVACLSLGGFVSSCGMSMDDVVDKVKDDNFTLSIGKTVIAVGEEVQLTVNSAVEDEEFLFVSKDESVATVSDTGLIKGIGEGHVTISVFDKKDFSVSKSIGIKVTNDLGNDGEKSSVLVIETSKAQVEFEQGDFFSLNGLVVKKDGVETKDFSSNPKEGFQLNSLGEIEVVISSSGAESVSYKITVTEKKEDLSLQNVVAKLLATDKYKYSVEINAKVQLDDKTSANSIKYNYTYGTNAFYLKTFVNNEVYDTYNYGYVNTENGVLKYKEKDEAVTLVSYSTHLTNTYKETGLTTNVKGFEVEAFPTRKTNDTYLITNSNLVGTFASTTMTNLSGVYKTIQRITASVESENSLKVVLECGLYGTIVETFSEIETAEVPYISEFIEANGTKIDVDADLVKATDLLKTNNFTKSLGTFTDGDGKKQSAGTYEATEKYALYDYSDAYIKYTEEKNKEDSKVTVAARVVKYKKGNYIYTIPFTKTVVDGVETFTLGKSTKKYNKKTLAQVEGYPGAMKFALSTNLDLFEFKESSLLNNEKAYIASNDKLPDELYDSFGLTSATGYFPYQVGVYPSLNETSDALSQVIVFLVVTSFSGDLQGLGTTYTGFGTVSHPSLDEALLKI